MAGLERVLRLGYYTPDEKYRISKLTDQTSEDPALRSKQCILPSIVDDPRFPPDSIKYVFAIHNHLYDDRISDRDIEFIIGEAREHGFEVETRSGKITISVIAFFANDFEKPACDGFYQYIPATHQILKWTRAQEKWDCQQTHRVTWYNGDKDFSVEETQMSCVGRQVQ